MVGCLAALLTSGCFIPIGATGTETDRPRDVAVAARPESRGGAPGAPRLDQLTVNNETIMAEDVWRGHLEELTDRAKSLTLEGFRAYASRRGGQLINDKITESVLYQKAKLRASPAFEKQVEGVVDQEIRRIVTTEHGGRELRYEKALAAQGQTRAGAREGLNRQIIARKFLEQSVEPKTPEPTRAELLEAFEREAPALYKAPVRRMSLIDVRLAAQPAGGGAAPNGTQAEAGRAHALERIREAKAALDRGDPFATVARQYSDGNHALDGGSWGWVRRGSVTQRFEPAVEMLYQLPNEGTTDLVEHAAGFFLVRCDEIDPGRAADFETSQPILLDRLKREAFNREAIKLVNELRATARLEPSDPTEFHRAVVRIALDRRRTILGTNP